MCTSYWDAVCLLCHCESQKVYFFKVSAPHCLFEVGSGTLSPLNPSPSQISQPKGLWIKAKTMPIRTYNGEPNMVVI